MARYAIMRASKVSGQGNLASSLDHAFRERETPNADEQRTGHNERWQAQSRDEAMGKARELWPEKHRKDAVLAVEYVMTASPEWWEKASTEQHRDFFGRAHDWLADKYGRDRIIAFNVHHDERSPHVSAFVVPLTADGRLSAKEFIGNRSQMKADQTSYADKMKGLGLERGIEGSKAHHQTVKDYYAALNNKPKQAVIKDQDLKPQILGKWGWRRENRKEVAQRLTRSVQGFYQHSVKAAAGASIEREKAQQWKDTAAKERQKAEQKQQRIDALEDRVEQMKTPFVGLTQKDMTQIINQARDMARERDQAEKAGIKQPDRIGDKDKARQADKQADRGQEDEDEAEL